MLNWKRNLLVAVLFAVAFFLQYGLLNNLGWGVFCPQLLVFFPIYAGILEGSKSGLICGVVTGLLLDLVIGRFIGLNVLIWALIGWLAGIYTSRYFKENYLLPILAVVICLTIHAFLYAFMVGVIGGYWVTLPKLVGLILGGALVNGIIAPIVYLPVYRSVDYGILKKRHLDDSPM